MLNTPLPPPPQPFNQDKQNNNMKKQAAEETGLICTLMNIAPFLHMHLFGLLRSPSKRGFSVALALNLELRENQLDFRGGINKTLQSRVLNRH